MSQEVRNLDDTPENFEFILGGHTYQMRYPTTEEVEKSVGMDEDKQTEWMYSFITAVSEGAPSIAETIKKVNVKKMKAFANMISEEFAG